MTDRYISQHHNCYFQIEVDRLLIELRTLHRQNKDLEYKMNILQKKSTKYDEFVERNRLKNQSKRQRRRLQLEQFVESIPKIDEDIERELFELFANLRNLDDIVKLKENTETSSRYLSNLKYCRLRQTFDAVKELNDVIGMTSMKEKIFQIICFYICDPQLEALSHIAINGPPGIGKTFVAQLIAKVMLSLGVLTKNKFIVATRKDMVGKYLGHTANETQAIIDSALGGVLFIDEAYSFGHSDGADSFSKECLDCLNENLTKNKGKFLCIIAGYKNELETCFFSANPGLASRFPQSMRITLTPYSVDELHRMFLSKVKDAQWTTCDPSKMLKLFEKYHKQMTAYGRDITNLFEQCKIIACTRIMRSTINFGSNPQIELEDLKKAFEMCFALNSHHDIPPMYL